MQAGAIGKWAGVALMLVIGVIHLITAPEQFNDATYKGLLFLANAGGAAVAAAGIAAGFRWSWLLGVLVAGGALAGYVISRTAGLPGLPVDPQWFEPLGILSIITEAAFLVATAAVMRPRRSTESRHVPARVA